MILFEEDWARYPHAIAHVSTTNRSFVEIAYAYKQMGIRNHMFLLALHDRSLEHIDPHDPNISHEMALRVIEECRVNPWYYFREVARIPVTGSPIPIRLRAHRGNVALWWGFFNHLKIYLVQTRQTGKSVGADSLNRYLLNVGANNTQIHILTKDDSLRRTNIERMKEFEKVLPSYLQMSVKSDPNNGEYIQIGALNNSYIAHVPRNSEKDAYKVGRGITSAIIQIDEFAYIPWFKATLTTILSSTTTAVDNARANGSHYGIILTSTAGKKDDRDGGFAYDILSKAMPFTEKIFDCKNQEELEKFVRKHNKDNDFAVNCTFDHLQLGKDDDWLYEKIVNAKISGEDADRDYFNVWTTGSAGNPIPVRFLEAMRKSQRKDFYTQIDPIHYYSIRWYIPESMIDTILNEGNVVLGVDTSDAIGRDEIALVFTDINTMEVLGVAAFNETNLIEFAMWLYDVLVKYPKLTMIIERRSSGPAIIDYLLMKMAAEGMNAFKRLYNKVVQAGDDAVEDYNYIRRLSRHEYREAFTRYKSSFGFATSGAGETSRNHLYSTILQSAARHGADRIHDASLIDQITGLDTKNGRIDHSAMKHDDHVIAWLMTNWLVMSGKNLSFYGIDTRTAMTNTFASSRFGANNNVLEDVMQNGYREKIETLLKELRQSRDEFTSYRLETEIRSLTSKLVLRENETFNVSELIQKARDSRAIRKETNQMSRQYGIYDSAMDFYGRV